MTDSFQAQLDSGAFDDIECLVPDINGLGKGKTVPVKQVREGSLRMPEGIFGQDILGAWCEDYDLIDVADVDVAITPVNDTLSPLPWGDGKTAQCIFDVQLPDGSTSNLAPRQLLQKVLALYDDMGLGVVVAQEAEFYLVDPNPDPNMPLQPATGRSGRRPSAARSFQMEALAEYGEFTEKLNQYAKSMNIEMSGLVHEMGRGQLEVNFVHGDPLKKADEMFNFKRAAREAAIACGKQATFLAKPLTNEPGCASHLHQSLWDKSSDSNVFVSSDGSYTSTFYSYLAGLQAYTPAVTAIYAPNVNSYRRFEGMESSPTNVEWGIDNRTTGFRIPKCSADATRIENRIPGSDSNPYLAIAISLACGYLGLQAKLKPSDPVAASAWKLPHSLPRSLNDALAALKACAPITELFGDRFVNLFINLKEREAQDFADTVSAWEREHLLII